MSCPGSRVQIQSLADGSLALVKFLLICENRTQCKQRLRVPAAAQFNGFSKRLLCVSGAPQFQVRHSYLEVSLVVGRKFRDRALKVRQAPGCVVFCQALDALLEGVKGFWWNTQFSDGNYRARLRGLRARKERQKQARGQQPTDAEFCSHSVEAHGGGVRLLLL